MRIPDDERSLNDLVQKAKEAIKRLHDLIHNAVENSNQHLKERLEAIKAKADKVLAETKEKIHQEIEKVKANIQKIKEEAAILGVDIKECLVEHENELQAIPLNMIEKLIECIKDEIKKATDIVKSAVQEIIDIKNQLVNLPGQLKSCLTTTKPVTCISDLIGDIVQKIAQVPADIQAKINEIMELVNNIEADLTKCAISKVFETGKEAAQVGIKVAKCVADKIKEE